MRRLWLLSLVLLIQGCSIDIKSFYYEMDNAGNGTPAGAEISGLGSNGWYEIEGTISSINDVDYYHVALPSSAFRVDLNLEYEYAGKDHYDLNFFNFHLIEYNASDDNYHYFLGEKSSVNIDLSSPQYLHFVVMGSGDFPGGTYNIQFRVRTD